MNGESLRITFGTFGKVLEPGSDEPETVTSSFRTFVIRRLSEGYEIQDKGRTREPFIPPGLGSRVVGVRSDQPATGLRKKS